MLGKASEWDQIPRESVDDMSDDEFKDMMKRYAAENFSSMTRKYADNFGSIKNSHSN